MSRVAAGEGWGQEIQLEVEEVRVRLGRRRTLSLARLVSCTLRTTPYALRSAPYTLPYTLHPTPPSPHPTANSLRPTPSTLFLASHTLHPEPNTSRDTLQMAAKLRERDQTIEELRGTVSVLEARITRIESEHAPCAQVTSELDVIPYSLDPRPSTLYPIP